MDDEIKIWTPSSKTKVSRNEIEETVTKNADKSSQGIHGPGNIIGGQMLWQILRHIQRSERRRARVREKNSGVIYLCFGFITRKKLVDFVFRL